MSSVLSFAVSCLITVLCMPALIRYFRAKHEGK